MFRRIVPLLSLALLTLASLSEASLRNTVSKALSIDGASSPASVALQWTAPGDNGAVGKATRYDLRYSTSSITESNFTLATTAPGVAPPLKAGSVERFTVSNLLPNVSYYFAIKAQDTRGNWSKISNVVSRQARVLALGSPDPMALSFSAPWPNPASSSVRFGYSLPTAAPVQLDVFDLAGRRVREVATGIHEAGSNELNWDLRDASGSRVEPAVYLVRARIGDRTWMQRLIVVR